MVIYGKYIILLFMLLPSIGGFSQGGNYIVDYATLIKIEKDKLILEKSYLIQINNKQSDWITDVEIPFNAEDKLEIFEASIINSDGVTVRKLKKKEIETRSDISNNTFYEDNLIREFKLKWHEYPYRIKYSYRKTLDKFVYVARWFPIVYTNVFIEKASLQVYLPEEFEANIDHSDDLDYRTETINGNKTHYWMANNIQPLKNEIFAPSYQERLPQVTIVPKRFTYGLKGSFDSWTSYGEWLEQMNEGLDILPVNEKLKANKILEGVTDTMEIIRKLYHYLQDNTRYINVAIDVGGLKPYSATYVSDNKYGDCKALTIYMKALLKYKNIPSFYTAIYAGDNPVQIKKDLPSQQFNHVILNVPVEGDTLWLENTASHIPYNYLGTFTQNRYALLVDGQNSTLIKTPQLSLEDVREIHRYNFTLDMDGNGTLNLSKDLKGEGFETYKYVQHELSEKDQKHYLEKNMRINDFSLLSWNFSQPDRDEPRIQLDLTLSVEKQLRQLASTIVLKPFSLWEMNFEKPTERKSPVRINYPVNKQDTLIYNLPRVNEYIVEMPNNISIESKYGRYQEHYIHKNNQFIISRSLQLYAGHYELQEYIHLYEFVDKIKTSTQNSAILLNPLK